MNRFMRIILYVKHVVMMNWKMADGLTRILREKIFHRYMNIM